MIYLFVMNKKSDDVSTLTPFYIVEVRTVKGTDQEKMKNMTINYR